MKKYLSILSLLVSIFFYSCGTNESKTIVTTEPDTITVSETSDENIDYPEIKDGKYYFVDGNGYIEITEGKYIQLVDFDEEIINEIIDFYKVNGVSKEALLFEQANPGEHLSREQLKEISDRCNNSTQIQDELINNRAEFSLNMCDTLMYAFDTDCEITYKLDDYQLYFALIYVYKNQEYRLISDDFRYEFELRE